MSQAMVDQFSLFNHSNRYGGDVLACDFQRMMKWYDRDVQCG